MITLHRLKRESSEVEEINLRPIEIEQIESIPDSVITLLDGKTHIVKEGVDEIIDKVLNEKKGVF